MASFPHIYLITNLINGKIYVGQSNGQGRYYFSGGVHINKALKKYGKKSFRKEILVEGDFSREDLNILEIIYISKFDSTNKKIGYNQLKGGLGGNGLNHTKEAIEKIRARSRKDDNRLRIREIQKKAVEARKGTHHSRESRLLMSISRSKSKIRRVIEQYDTDDNLIGHFDFISDASSTTGIGMSNIKNNLYGLSNTCKGFKFKFKEVIQ